MTFLSAATAATEAAEGVKNVNISASDATIVAVLGYVVVFVGLIALMLVVMAIGTFFSRKAREKKAGAAQIEQAAPAAEPTAPQTAPGSAGQLKLHNVEPKTAAMLMAIVADKMGKPLNELRFISIKEVE